MVVTVNNYLLIWLLQSIIFMVVTVNNKVYDIKYCQSYLKGNCEIWGYFALMILRIFSVKGIISLKQLILF